MAHLLRHPLTPVKDILIVVDLQRQQVHTGKRVTQVDGVGSKYQPFPVLSAIDQETKGLLCVMPGAEGHNLQAADAELRPRLHRGNEGAVQSFGGPLACEDLYAGFDHVHHTLGVVFVLMANEAPANSGEVKAQLLFNPAEGDAAFQQNRRLAIAGHIAVSARGTGKRGKGHMGFSSF